MRRSIGEFQYYGLPIRLNKAERHSLANILNGMIFRCYNNSGDRHYQYYGGRGISICVDWYNNETGKPNYKNFIWWAEKTGFKLGLQIDRIDVNGNYCPENCRWVTRVENGRNKRNNRIVEFNGESHPASYWAEKTGIGFCTLTKRLNKGWSIEQTLTTPVRPQNKKIEFRGRSLTIREWEEKLGFPRESIKQRLCKLGWSVERALTEPVEIGNNHPIEYQGERMNMKGWAKRFNIPFRIFERRFLDGWPMERIRNQPIRVLKRRKHG